MNGILKWLFGILSMVIASVLTAVLIPRLEMHKNIGMNATTPPGSPESSDLQLSQAQKDLPDSGDSGRADYTETQYGIMMVYVKGGTFTMGCTREQGNDCEDDEKPAHEVTLSDFYIGRYTVTQAQWKSIMGSNPSFFKGDNLPVENVNWNDIQEFIQNLNKRTGRNYRLPTESEWEYAARGGNQSQGYKYSGSHTLEEVAWYEENHNERPSLVGNKKANELGIYDMSGNVWELVNDWHDGYSRHPQTNPDGPLTGTNRVYRGGSWDLDAGNARVSCRSSGEPGSRYDNLGFRLARSAK